MIFRRPIGRAERGPCHLGAGRAGDGCARRAIRMSLVGRAIGGLFRHQRRCLSPDLCKVRALVSPRRLAPKRRAKVRRCMR